MGHAKMDFFYIKCLLVILLEQKLGSRKDPGLGWGVSDPIVQKASNYVDWLHLRPPPLLLPSVGLGAAFKSLPWSLSELGCTDTDFGQPDFLGIIKAVLGLWLSLGLVGLLAESRYSHGAHSGLAIWVQQGCFPCPRLLSQPALLTGFHLTFPSRDIHPYLLPDKSSKPLSLASITSAS